MTGACTIRSRVDSSIRLLPRPRDCHCACYRKDGRYEWKAKHDPNGIGKFYMGREIAHVMGHAAASWLERPRARRKRKTPRNSSNC